jgi:hypothetical protein
MPRGMDKRQRPLGKEKDRRPKYWDARKKHYNVKYVAKVEDKSGRIRYLNGQGKWIKPLKVSKVKSKAELS